LRGVLQRVTIHTPREAQLTRTRLALFAPAAVALAVAGCGSSSGGSTPASSGGGGAYGQPSASSTSSSTSPALISTKQSAKLGTILAFGPKQLTVYLFEGDKAGAPSCAGACASVWPPVTGTPQAQGSAMSADLATITRSDGSKQVTYKGHPLYLFIKDKDNCDAYGQGQKAFGADWYVLAPSGNKVDKS
jgi:predicted lipoprotein with Yx(FWY)xxD motif